MTVTIAKPDKYAKCICCGSSNKHDLCEFQLFKNTEVKMCTSSSCKNVVKRRYRNKLEVKDDRRTMHCNN